MAKIKRNDQVLVIAGKDKGKKGRVLRIIVAKQRVLKSNKKFYAHDEQNSARVGDMVRIRETRPLSKLKRWSLEEIIRRSSLSALPDEKPSRAENAIQKA